MILPYIFVTILFLFYIQYSPKMGNIWYRNGYFVPRGAINLMIYPLKEIKMWNPKLWDINYFMWIIITYMFYEIIHFPSGLTSHRLYQSSTNCLVQ